MTSITSTTDTAATTAAAAATKNTAAPLGKISADFNMFLKLLTTQMQNQDPLKPMDSTAYTAQLAQFSQVEQTIQQTGTLKDILASLGTQNLSQASGYIDREATFDSAVSGLAGANPAQWNYSAAQPLDSFVAKISNDAGTLVDTRVVTATGTSGRFDWDGKLSGGGQAPDGAYTIALSGVATDGSAVTMTPNSVGTVKEVVNAAGVVSLGVNGIQLPASTLLRVAERA